MRKLTKRIISRIVVYAVILASAFYALKFLLSHFNLPYADIDNTRYLLSAMVQSQAAIVAIVITMSLVAVQLAASTYSPRVIDVFKYNPDFWLLLSLYAGSLLYDSLVLIVLNERTSTFHVFTSYWLCASAVLALFPYTLSMINILNPEAIIRQLSDDIDRGSWPTKQTAHIVGNYSLIYHQHPQRDPFQPIIDIARGALARGDYKTAHSVLRIMTTKVIKVINSYSVGKYQFIPGKRRPYNPYIGFSEHYCAVLAEIGEFFAARDEELTLQTILELREVGRVITEKRLGTERDVIDVVRRIGKSSAHKGFQTATRQAMDVVVGIVTGLPCDVMIVPKEYEAPEYRYPCRKPIESALSAIGDVGTIALTRWGAYELQAVSRNLEQAGIKIAMEADKWDSVWELTSVAIMFNRLGIITLNIEEDPTDTTEFILQHHVIRPLQNLVSIIGTTWHLFCWDKIPGKDNMRLEEFLIQKFAIAWVRTAKIEKRDGGTTIKVSGYDSRGILRVLSLRLNDEKTRVKLEVDDITATLYARLESDGLNIYYREKRLTSVGGDTVKRFVFALWDIGAYAARKRWRETTRESAKALAELAVLLDEGTVEGELNNLLNTRQYRELGSESLEACRKFVEAYDEHLNRLKVSKGGGQNREQPDPNSGTLPPQDG